MKRLCVVLLTLALSLSALAQETVYVDASAFPLYGKATPETSALYTRLPIGLKDVLRQELWELGCDSAGLFVRFRTNSKNIYARWESLYGFAMNHMTPTGVRGLDLYGRDGDEWMFFGSARPSTQKETTTKCIGGMDGQMREYILYLSLYDGVTKLEIGIDEDAVIETPVLKWPVYDRPVVMYGTSLLQGGCANRAGMAFTNIIGRRLDREVVNLGFSGNGRLDLEIAELMAAMPDPGVYVMDNLPNCTVDRVREATVDFFRILRDAHPDVPVIFVENAPYMYQYYDKKTSDDWYEKNGALKEIFDSLKKQGEKQIYYVRADNMLGNDHEATVDGTHFTDLGMVRYSDLLTPVIEKVLKKANK